MRVEVRQARESARGVSGPPRKLEEVSLQSPRLEWTADADKGWPVRVALSHQMALEWPGLLEVNALKSRYKKTALFLIAMVFERGSKNGLGRTPVGPGAHLAICAKAVEALTVDDWNNGVQKLEELVDIC